VPSLLVTNDFPPKVGGIQSYLWELWRRLPPGDVTVLTTRHAEAAAFDAEQAFRVERAKEWWLLPTRDLARRIDALADEVDADVILLDPALPLGELGRRLSRPYVVVVHGAEVAIPARLPAVRAPLRRVLDGAVGVLAAGGYPAAAACALVGRPLPTLVIPPGVDVDRFHPFSDGERRAGRARLGLPVDGPLVVGVSRLVVRKGFDTLLAALARLPGVHLALAGGGRDRRRLELLARRRGVADRVTFLGRVADDDLAVVHGVGDVFAMLCRDRWAGLEQEGFGIVFVEAAAAGVPAVAGRSGGSHEAVVDGETGLVVDPGDLDGVVAALGGLLADPDRRRALGAAARARVEAELAYDHLAARLTPLVQGDTSVLAPFTAAR
jgi:phosphatidyl-myo-inositol dimannoside synthase